MNAEERRREVAVVITALQAGRIDGQQAVASAAALVEQWIAEAEIAGQMRHITAEVARGDVPLSESEELIADLRARISHVEAERDQRHDGWAQSVKNEATLHREIETWREAAADAERRGYDDGRRDGAAATVARVEAVAVEWERTPGGYPVAPWEYAHRLRAALASEEPTP